MKVPFVDCKGQRAIKGAYKLDKFCEQCGTKLQNNKAKLTKHCNKFHKAIQCGFLKSNQLPKDSLYLNFEAYLDDPATCLIEDQTKVTKRAGRPTKASLLARALFDPAQDSWCGKSVIFESEQDGPNVPEKTDTNLTRAHE